MATPPVTEWQISLISFQLSIEPSNSAAAGLTLDEARGAAFLGISWIEQLVCLDLVLGIYLSKRMHTKATNSTDQTGGVQDNA
jgi:hypothetical protein